MAVRTRDKLSVSEAAALCDVDYDTFLSWIRKEIVPHVRVGPGRSIRVLRSDVEKQIEYRQPKAAETISGIYFIRCAAFVKIGMTTDVWGRIACLQAACPYPLELLALEPWPPAELRAREQVLHQQFRRFHHRLEWFRLEADLASYIAAISTQTADSQTPTADSQN